MTQMIDSVIFDTWKLASEFIAALRPGLDAAKATIRMYDEAGLIEWLGLNTEGGSDPAWDRLCILPQSDWLADEHSPTCRDARARGPFVVLVCHFSANSLRDATIKHTLRRITRVVYE